MPAPSAEARRIRGEYFTPPPLVQAVLSLAVPHVGPGPLTVVDPACGDGAFLAAAARAFPRARLHGLELDPTHAASARRGVPAARILVGDALRGGWDALARALPGEGEELWLGNPPYNGTSPLLRDARAYRALRARVDLDEALPRGTSLRDDYAFFLLLASERLARRAGVLAWVTSATLLDAYLYAPLRRRLLDRLELREVVDLGPAVFPGTRVRTCITVWRSRRGPAPSPRFRAWAPGSAPVEASAPRRFRLEGPEWSLRPVPAEAERLDARWRARGEPLDVLVPVSCTGLKTRFDELLVDEDAERLVARVDAFLRTRDLPRFAHAHGIPPRAPPQARGAAPFTRPPLARRSAGGPPLPPLGGRAPPRGPPGELAGSLLPRPPAHPARRPPAGGRLRPARRRLQAGLQPARAAARRRPARGARLHPCPPPHPVRAAPRPRARPERGAARRALRAASLGPLVPNLSPAGLAWAERVGGPREAFRRIAAFVNSPEVQEVWAPAFGCTRVLPVPLDDG